MKKKQYKLKSKILISNNKRFNIYFDNLIINKKSIKKFLMIRPIVKKKDKIVGICIVPEFKKKFGLMKVWRHQFNESLWQVPAGFVEKNETVEFTAIKELQEEAGLNCEKKNLKFLGKMVPDAGLLEGKVALFLAIDCKKTSDKISPEIGVNKMHFFNKKVVKEMLIKNKVINGSSYVALSKALNFNG